MKTIMKQRYSERERKSMRERMNVSLVYIKIMVNSVGGGG